MQMEYIDMELYPSPMSVIDKTYSKWRVKMRKYLLNLHNNDYDQMLKTYNDLYDDDFFMRCRFLIKDKMTLIELPNKIKELKEKKIKQKCVSIFVLNKISNLSLDSVRKILAFL